MSVRMGLAVGNFGISFPSDGPNFMWQSRYAFKFFFFFLAIYSVVKRSQEFGESPNRIRGAASLIPSSGCSSLENNLESCLTLHFEDSGIMWQSELPTKNKGFEKSKGEYVSRVTNRREGLLKIERGTHEQGDQQREGLREMETGST